MESAIRASATTLGLNTRLFGNCLRGVREEDAGRRVTDHDGTIRAIACHLVDARAYLGRLLGADTTDPLVERLARVKAVAELNPPPTLAEAQRAWAAITARVVDRLEALTARDLGRTTEATFPVPDRTLLGGTAFLLQHESYHLGQLGLLRRQLGYDAMGYDDAPAGD